MYICVRCVYIFCRNITQEASVRWWQLPEISTKYNVQASKRVMLTVFIFMKGLVARDSERSLQSISASTRALTILISSMMSQRHCSNCFAISCCFRNSKEFVFCFSIHWQIQSMMDGVSSQQVCHYCLQCYDSNIFNYLPF